MLVAVWLGAPALVVATVHGPRLLWTVLIASLPLAWVLGGYHLWRRVCPLAWIAMLPARLGREGQRKIPVPIAENALLVQLGLMVLALSLRLLALNSTPAALALFLVTVSLLALAAGFVYRGRTWCNHLCPVGLVEKLYTEPRPLVDSGNSQCSRCTACTRHCPDIDLEQSYWKSAEDRGRRLATYAWPGIVLAFYAAFALRAGSWDWYFSGAWAYQPETLASLLGPGLSFAPIPHILVAPALLITAGGLSLALFTLVEGLLRRHSPAQARHRSLAVAAFTAFVVFYAFAGQPTLRAGPAALQWAVAVLVVVAATMVLHSRWPRSEEAFVRDRFRQRLARKWQWSDAARIRPEDLVAVHEERVRARQEKVAAWRDTLVELAAEGTVTRAQLSALDVLRRQLDIGEAEHRQALAALDAADRARLEGEGASPAEELQRRQYREALELLVDQASESSRAADPAALERLRVRFGVDPAAHRAALDALRDPTAGPIRVATEAIAQAEALADIAAAGAALAPGPEAELLRAAARHEAAAPIARARAVLATLGARQEDPLVARLAAVEQRLRTAADGPPDAMDSLPAHGRWVRTAGSLVRAMAGLSHIPDPDPLVQAAAGARPLDALGEASPTLLDRLRLLHRVPLLAGLPLPSLLLLAQAAELRRYAEGERLCTQGEAGDQLFVLVSGEVEAWRTGPAGERQALIEFGSGACIGELAVIAPAPRTATMCALVPTTALVIDGEPFRALLAGDAELAGALLRELAQRLQR